MKVLLGLSGGVDSAVAAYLLLKQGYEVEACFMRNWDALANNDYLGNPTINNDQCPQEKDYWDAVEVAKKLGIKLHRVDFIKEYWDKVFSYFLKEYEKGRTPNPDVFCNKHIKFDSFREYAIKNGFDMIAMGHYAGKEKVDGIEYIKKAHDGKKDQSYFLCQINEEQISSCLFPLDNIEKEEVRRIAKELDLSTVMNKKDSTGICFIGERNFKDFLHNYFPAQNGKIIEGRSGKILGEHVGVLYYTIGQRHGLNIGGVKGEGEGAYFVYKKDVKNNILYVAHSEQDELLYSTSVIIDNVNWIGPKPDEEIEVGVKFRYRQPDQMCKLRFVGDKIELTCLKPVKAICPGQIAAIYKGDILLGGGIIDSTYRNGIRNDI